MERQFLWVNLCDLSELGTITPFGSPLNFMVRPELGDKRLIFVYSNNKRVDEGYVVISSTPQRCDAIKNGIELVGIRKIGRKVRTRLTTNPPTKAWRRVYAKALRHPS